MTFDHSQLRAFIASVFSHAGSEAAEARIVADHLVEANLQGHDSHGVWRVARYMDRLKAGNLRANQRARVTVDSGPLIRVEGDLGYGQVIARQAMTLGIARAQEAGAAVLAVCDCAHMGRIGAWAEMAAEAGLVSIHFVNTTGAGIMVAPFGGRDRRLSSNPIAAGIPVPGRPPVILDLATTVVAEGKIQVAFNKGTPLPEGCIIDAEGRPSRDPADFYADPPGAMLPFGGHKGSGLSFLCEVLAGSLTGGRSGHPDNAPAGRLVNNMLAIIVETGRFWSPDDYAGDVARLVAWVGGSRPSVPGGEVLFPGDLERRTREERLAGGVPLDDRTLEQVRDAARSVGVPEAEIQALAA